MKLMSFNLEMEKLLKGFDLPYQDLVDTNTVRLFGHEENDQLVGMAGLERYGNAALLRSLAVSESRHGCGLGIKMVRFVEEQAAKTGVENIYLLTTTAENFFERLGYSQLSRELAPTAISSTAEFSNLCPASAVFMVKQL